MHFIRLAKVFNEIWTTEGGVVQTSIIFNLEG